MAFEANQIQFPKGNRKIYNSSPGVGRGFCDQCGTPLTWEGKSRRKSIIEVHISTLDNPDAYIPDRHWHHSERIVWFDVADDLPRYRQLDIDMEPYCQGPAGDVPSL